MIHVPDKLHVHRQVFKLGSAALAFRVPNRLGYNVRHLAISGDRTAIIAPLPGMRRCDATMSSCFVGSRQPEDNAPIQFCPTVDGNEQGTSNSNDGSTCVGQARDRP